MDNLPFIPASATPSNILLRGVFHELAIGLTRAAAKRKLVIRYTGIKAQAATALHRAIHRHDPASGPIRQYNPAYFTNASDSARFSGLAWNLQGATFLSIYGQVKKSCEVMPHEGWLLLTTYNAYLKATDKLAAHFKTKSPDKPTAEERLMRLDINQAYALLAFAAVNTIPESAELKLKTCPECGVDYLVNTSFETMSQKCPIHTMSENCQRLTVQSRSARKRSTAA
ncbi:MAG: hypothetical protein D4R84_02575 [Rhodocyclaceae bacterium]|nr:MAG: hypothetical protein D4R84_02575 [Rhodocyclaceae bacterium]